MPKTLWISLHEFETGVQQQPASLLCVTIIIMESLKGKRKRGRKRKEKHQFRNVISKSNFSNHHRKLRLSIHPRFEPTPSSSTPPPIPSSPVERNSNIRRSFFPTHPRNHPNTLFEKLRVAQVAINLWGGGIIRWLRAARAEGY